MDDANRPPSKYNLDSNIVPFFLDFQHIFHSKCIDKWLENHTTCPMCRQPAAVRNSRRAARSQNNHRSSTQPNASSQPANPAPANESTHSITYSSTGAHAGQSVTIRNNNQSTQITIGPLTVENVRAHESRHRNTSHRSNLITLRPLTVENLRAHELQHRNSARRSERRNQYDQRRIH